MTGWLACCDQPGPLHADDCGVHSVNPAADDAPIEVRIYAHALGTPYEVRTMRVDELEAFVDQRGTPLVIEINAL